MDLPETLWVIVCNLQIITLQCDKINLQETLRHCHYSQGLWAKFKSRFFYRNDAKPLRYTKVIVKKFFV